MTNVYTSLESMDNKIAKKVCKRERVIKFNEKNRKPIAVQKMCAHDLKE